jgi:hypothetical protein
MVSLGSTTRSGDPDLAGAIRAALRRRLLTEGLKRPYGLEPVS